MTAQLPPGDDGSRMAPAANFRSWPGDPFVNEPRQWGQTDYTCNVCNRLGRHPWSPDVPPGWWFFYDQAQDVVHLACRLTCVVKFTPGYDPRNKTPQQVAQDMIQRGWHRRPPEQAGANEATGLAGGWNSGSL